MTSKLHCQGVYDVTLTTFTIIIFSIKEIIPQCRLLLDGGSGVTNTSSMFKRKGQIILSSSPYSDTVNCTTCSRYYILSKPAIEKVDRGEN